MSKLFNSDDDDFGYLDDSIHINWKKLLPAIIIVAAAVIALIIVLIVSFGHRGKKVPANASSTEETSSVSETDTDGNNTLSDKDEKEQDPQYSDNNGAMNQDTGNGASVILSNSTNETSDVTIGVDVSKFQGTIDWAQAASSGVDFAMIRVGYRAQKTGVIYADTNAKYNMQQAAANGIKVGVYFFSSAVNESEAIEEADWVADFIADYSITYPVAFDCEGFYTSESRQKSMTKAERTTVAVAFLQEIYDKGYTPMFYAASSELTNNSQWNTAIIEKSFKIWVAQYPSTPYPETPSTSYAGTCSMWQYTNQGRAAESNPRFAYIPRYYWSVKYIYYRSGRLPKSLSNTLSSHLPHRRKYRDIRPVQVGRNSSYNKAHNYPGSIRSTGQKSLLYTVSDHCSVPPPSLTTGNKLQHILLHRHPVLLVHNERLFHIRP